jgi:opacity protein-like surface antigen
MQRRIAVIAAAVALAGCASAARGPDAGQAPVVRPADLERLAGAEWQGTLSYLDYGSGRKTSIRSNVTVTPSGEPSRWIFAHRYPDEPRADSRDTVVLAADGRTLAGETVVERATLADGTLRIVTEKPGRDNDRPATFRYTYLIAPARVSIRKEVRVDGTAEFFERNEYAWTR